MDFQHPVEAVIPGVQGHILAVLSETTDELNLRTIARLAGVSSAQVSRVLPELVTLGLVARREAPPSALFALVDDHVAARLVRELSQARRSALDELGVLARCIDPQPISVVVFGSLARGDADAESDIDVLLIRPDGVDEDDEGWASSVEEWRTAGRRLTGDSIELLEIGQVDIGRRLARRSAIWADVVREGIVISGASLDDLRSPPVPKQSRTRKVTAAQVHAYVGKAEEYMSAAEAELEAERSIAATSLAIHAGINGGDAVTGVRLGVRAAGQDHDEVLRLLKTAGPDGNAVAKDLGRLLPMKNRAEYEPDEIPRADASRAVDRARRILAVARRVADAQSDG